MKQIDPEVITASGSVVFRKDFSPGMSTLLSWLILEPEFVIITDKSLNDIDKANTTKEHRLMLNLPANFETYNQARKNGFLKMKELKDAGQRLVGTFCSFVPTELVEAAGGTVVSLCASSEEPIAAAEANLPRNLCPLIKASYGFALTDTCPYFYFSDFIVGETTCDGKKKMFELMNEIKETFVMQLPSSRDEQALDA